MKKSSDQLVLGVDLGGTKILTAVVDSEGLIISRDHSVTPAEKGKDAVINAIYQSFDRVLSHAHMDISEIVGIGIGAPGPSNPDTGILFSSPNLMGWQDVPIKEIIETKLGKKTFLINDANAAALGEFFFGAAKGARHFIYITLSTGIGGGIVIDGKIYTGAIGTAGEIGHMTIDVEGPLCNCGNRGCWEAMASGTALAREARYRINEGARTSILDYSDDSINNITAEVVHKAAQKGDALAEELIARVGYYVGVGLANLLNLFNPEVVAIGGGLSHIGDMLLEPAFRVTREKAFKPSFESVRFTHAELGRNSGVLGAAAFALEEMKKKNER